MTSLPTLYSRTSNGNIQRWQINVEGNTFFTVEGLDDGKQTTSKPTIVLGKNTGKANATSDEEQALKEAKAKHKKKLEAGYFDNISDIDNEIHTEPMLAEPYDKVRPKWKSFIGCYSQPKLDGMRCIAKKDGLWSRGGKPILAVPHILRALGPFFETYPNAVIDGELYCDKYANDFNEIISLCKQAKPTPEDWKASEAAIEYWIYDLVSSRKTYGARRMDLQDILFAQNPHPALISVPTRWLDTQEEMDALYEKYMEDGYEGQIIRLDAPYEFKRTKSLIKRKKFFTAEWPILDITEAKGGRSGTAGRMHFKTDKGLPFEANIKANFKQLAEYLVNKHLYIGKPATIRYPNLTPDGKPRFGYVVAIRDYE